MRVVYCAVWERYDLTRDGSLRRRYFLHSFIVCEPAKQETIMHEIRARRRQWRRRWRWRWHEADPSVHNHNNWSYETTIKCIGDRKDAAAATAAAAEKFNCRKLTAVAPKRRFVHWTVRLRGSHAADRRVTVRRPREVLFYNIIIIII